MKSRLFLSAAMAAIQWSLPTAEGFVVYQGITTEFDSGSLAGRQFDGYISYDQRHLTGSGIEFLLRLDSELDKDRPMGPSEYDGFSWLTVTIDETPFSIADRFEYSGPPSLKFNNGILSWIYYQGLVEHSRYLVEEDRIDRVLTIDGFAKGSTWFLQDNLDSNTVEFSNGTTYLVSDLEGPGSRLANQLRYYGVSNWWFIKEGLEFSTPYADFVRNDEIDDNWSASAEGTALLIESLFAQSKFENGFGLLDENGGYQALLTNLNPKQSATIDLPVSGTEALGFAVDLGDGTSQLVPLSDNVHVRTYVSTDAGRKYILWMLDDTNDNTYRDFNDFIILATLNAVPEPVWVISILSLILIAVVLWRHRLRADGQT
ncbi:MAG: hypothetical protein R3F07_09770 [Opitutaceae bacterium]